MAHDDAAVGLVDPRSAAHSCQKVLEILGGRHSSLYSVVDRPGDVDGIDDSVVGCDQVDERGVAGAVIEPDIHRYLEGSAKRSMIDGRVKARYHASFDQSSESSAGRVGTQTGTSTQFPVGCPAITCEVAKNYLVYFIDHSVFLCRKVMIAR